MRQSALDGLRAYPGTAALITLALSIALATILPATVFGTLSDHGIQSRLGLAPIRGGELGLAWGRAVQSPAATQQEAVSTVALLLIGMAAAMLAIAAVTILTLASARESARSPELTVRRAVGASRRILLGGLTIEAVLLIAGALMIGGIAAWALGRAALARWPGVLHPGTLTLSMLAIVGLMAIVMFGILLPLLWPRQRLVDGEVPAPPPLAPTAFQLGVSLIVLTMSSIVTPYTAQLTRIEATSLDDGVVFPLTLTETSPRQRAVHYETLLHTFAARTSVHAVSLTSPGALVGLGPVSPVTTDCGLCFEGNLRLRWHIKNAVHHLVSSDSFRVLGLSLIAGRGITSTDTWDAPRVVVVSRSLALREFQDGQAIGRRIRVVDDGDRWSTVVGVVDDPSPTGFGGVLQPRYAVYLSVLQYPPTTADLVIRGPLSTDLVQATQAMAGVMPGSSTGLAHGRRESAVMAAEGAPATWFGWWFGVQGWAMLGLAIIGTFALMHLWVHSLRGEIAVRRATGARRSQVLRFVLVRAMGVGVAGVVIGLWFGSAIWGIAPTLLPGLPPWDTRVVVRLAMFLIGSALAGALLPAWRASRTTPVALLTARS